MGTRPLKPPISQPDDTTRYSHKIELEAPGLAELPTEHQLPGERLGVL